MSTAFAIDHPNDWNGMLFSDQQWKNFIDAAVENQRWALAVAISAQNGQNVIDVYNGLQYRHTSGSNSDFKPDSSIDLSFLNNLPDNRTYGSPSVHMHGDGLIHLDTADPYPLFPPFGLLTHFFVDVVVGNVNGGVPFPRSGPQ
jgi:hypothetical protein